MTLHTVPWTAVCRCSRWARCRSRARPLPSRFSRSCPGSHTDKPEFRDELSAYIFLRLAGTICRGNLVYQLVKAVFENQPRPCYSCDCAKQKPGAGETGGGRQQKIFSWVCCL